MTSTLEAHFGGSLTVRVLSSFSRGRSYFRRVLLALDARDGGVRVEGWTQPGGGVEDVLRSWSGWPSAGVVFTSTDRDGMLDGPDLEGLA